MLVVSWPWRWHLHAALSALMLERGWVSTDPVLVAVPDATMKSRCIQSYGKVVRNVLHMPFGGNHKKRHPRQSRATTDNEVGQCAGTCMPPCGADVRGK